MNNFFLFDTDGSVITTMSQRSVKQLCIARAVAQNPNFYVDMLYDIDSDNLNECNEHSVHNNHENLEERVEEEKHTDLSSCDEEPGPSEHRWGGEICETWMCESTHLTPHQYTFDSTLRFDKCMFSNRCFRGNGLPVLLRVF